MKVADFEAAKKIAKSNANRYNITFVACVESGDSFVLTNSEFSGIPNCELFYFASPFNNSKES